MKTKVCGALLGVLISALVAGCATSSHYARGTYYPPDPETLRANVKTAMWQDPSVAPFDVGVDVLRSTVHLTGIVDTPEQRRRAADIALAVPGVTAVDNDLLLRSAYGVTALGAPPASEIGRASDDPSVLLARVISSPDSYYGKTLEVQGTVDTVLSASSFTMYSAGIGMRDNPVLVIARDKDVRTIIPGDTVRVRGELEPFNRAAAAQRLNADLEPRKFDAWSNRATVLADSVRRL